MVNYNDLFNILIPGLVEIYQDNSMRIILYGSVARGTQTDESDVDIAVIIPAYTREMHDRMLDLLARLEIEYNTVLSIIMIDSEEFAEWENVLPFYKNVKEEGIVLWPAA